MKSRRNTSCRGSFSKCTRSGPPSIFVLLVAAEGGHFHLRENIAHQHHPEMRSHAAGVGEKVHDAVGPRVGGDVEILRLHSQQQVAHAATHQVSLVAGAAQPGDGLASQPFGVHPRVSSLPYANMWMPIFTQPLKVNQKVIEENSRVI